MKLIQITDKLAVETIRQSLFTFEVPSNIPTLMHSIDVDGELVGYVATEDYNTVGGPHIFIHDEFKIKPVMQRVSWLFTNVYCPLMKALGKEYLATNCDDADEGTKNFLRKAGFNIQTTVIAEYKL